MFQLNMPESARYTFSETPMSVADAPVWRQRHWYEYQLGFTWEEIHFTSLEERSKVPERVHFSESERVITE